MRLTQLQSRLKTRIGQFPLEVISGGNRLKDSSPCNRLCRDKWKSVPTEFGVTAGAGEFQAQWAVLAKHCWNQREGASVTATQLV